MSAARVQRTGAGWSRQGGEAGGTGVGGCWRLVSRLLQARHDGSLGDAGETEADKFNNYLGKKSEMGYSVVLVIGGIREMERSRIKLLF